MISPAALPDLSEPYTTSKEDIETYQRDGHVTLRGVLKPAEVDAYRRAITEAVQRLNQESRPLEERDTYGKAFLQTMNLWEFDEAAAKFTLSKRFGGIAAELMGVDRVRLYHDQALFKEAGGGPTPWHQDQFYWPIECRTVTMWMPLVPATTEMGTMKFAAGSRLKLLTEGSLQSGLYTTTSGNAPGQVTFSGFSGTQTCQPTVRTLGLMNTSVSTSVIVASVSGLSLPVVCR